MGLSDFAPKKGFYLPVRRCGGDNDGMRFGIEEPEGKAGDGISFPEVIPGLDCDAPIFFDGLKYFFLPMPKDTTAEDFPLKKDRVVGNFGGEFCFFRRCVSRHSWPQARR